MIPASLCHEVISASHDAPTASHFSTHKTYEKIRRHTFGPVCFEILIIGVEHVVIVP